MKNIALTITYDGTRYHGYQAQNRLLTVEGELVKALEKTVGHPVKLTTAGRTDKGVHAMRQRANFHSSTSIDLGNFPRVVNRWLPSDISIIEAVEKPRDFHSRRDARGKHYRYLIYCGKHRHALWENRAYFQRWPMDLSLMKRGLETLIGVHDFFVFMGPDSNPATTVREIQAIECTDRGEILQFDVYGKSFLKNMIRKMIGTAVEIGRGQRPLDHMALGLITGDRRYSGHTAPGCGLYLMDVYYDDEPERREHGPRTISEVYGTSLGHQGL